jgi:pyruvate formate lyase activating enzyme
MKEALFYSKKDDAVQCCLCSHRCVIKNNRRGICGVRENRQGTLYSLSYGRISAEHVDPVEKKPLFHFLPGSLTYSIATVGCNFKCLHCQNYSLSQVGPEIDQIPHQQKEPVEIVKTALLHGCRSISYTYSEPTVFFEFAYDCSTIARENGLKNVFVSNGFMTLEVSRMLAPVLDGINIDIKSFSDDFYSSTCGGKLQQVLDNVRFYTSQGVLVEVTTLIIPGLNDSEEEIRQIARFIAATNPDMAWHVSAFRPTYKMMDRQPTSSACLQRARDIGLSEGLKHVYVGNIRGGGGEDTYCPSCARTIIRRHGFSIQENLLDRGNCPDCSEEISGVW